MEQYHSRSTRGWTIEPFTEFRNTGMRMRHYGFVDDGASSAKLHHANTYNSFVVTSRWKRKEFFGTATGGLCASAVAAVRFPGASE